MGTPLQIVLTDTENAGPFVIPPRGVFVLSDGTRFTNANEIDVPLGGSSGPVSLASVAPDSTYQALFTPRTAAQIQADLLASLQEAGFPTTDWEDGAVAKTLVEIDAAALADLWTSAMAIGAGGLLKYSSGPWLDLLAESNYNLTRNQAIQAQGIASLQLAAGAGPYTVVPGQLWAISASTGLRFYNLTGGTLTQAAPTLPLLWGAELPAAKYGQVGAGDLSILGTALPGVSVSNPLINPDASALAALIPTPIQKAGTGTGSIALSGTPTGTQAHDFVISILTSGAVGVATWQYQLDGGAPLGPFTTSTSPQAIGATGLSVAFANGASGTSFVQNDTYSFGDSWLTVAGADIESDSALQTRCQDQWSALGTGATADAIELWAMQASPNVGAAQAVVDPNAADSPLLAGQVDLYVAGPDGPLASSDTTTVPTVQAYVNQRIPLTASVVVSAAAALSVTVGGTVYYPVGIGSSGLTSLESAIAGALASYAVAIGIGGTVRFSQVMAALQAVVGVNYVEGLTLNGGSSDVTLGAGELAAFSDGLSFVGQ